MSTVTETTVEALKSCMDSTCPGYEQRPVEGVLNVTEHSFLDGGGDLGPFTERSMHYLRFAHEDDSTCGVCSGPALIADQTRPVYPKSSNQPVQPSADGNMAKLYMDQRDEIAELKEMIAAQARSKPGPKPKGPEVA